jgi:hypothetical protein
VDFPFICDRGAAQQPVIAVEQDGIDAVFRQRQRNATSLKATSQYRDTHISETLNLRHHDRHTPRLRCGLQVFLQAESRLGNLA